MKNYFYLDDSPIYKDRYVIKLRLEGLPFEKVRGSYMVFQARLMNLSYAQYLRFCRDVLGADLVGKGARYVIPYVEDKPEVKQFLKLLNTRMEYALSVKKDPYTYAREGDEIVRTEINGN